MAGPAGTLSPSPKFVAYDDNGNPVSGGRVYSFYAGTTTPAPTYSDADLDVGHANLNPVILDGAGRATIFLIPGVSYKFILRSATDVQIWTQDNIAAVSPLQTGIDSLGMAGEDLTAGQVAYLSDGQGARIAGRWYRGDAANSYSSTEPIVGMVTAPILNGQVGSIRVVGAVTGLSGLVPGANHYIGGPGQLITTRLANARLVGVADTSTSLVLAANPASVAAGSQAAVLNVATTGTILVLPIPLGSGPLTVRMTGNANARIETIAPGLIGQTVTIYDGTVAAQVDLVHVSAAAGGNASGRLFNMATSAPSSLKNGGSATYIYDPNGIWRMIAHEQGGWITPVFNAADYNTPWVVAAGDVSHCRYRLSGRTLHVQWAVFGSVSASIGTLVRALPGGFIGPAGAQPVHVAFGSVGAGPFGTIACHFSAGTIVLYSSLQLAGWANGTVSTQIAIIGEVN